MKQKPKKRLGQGSSYTFFLLIILLLHLFLFSGCGIPIIPYLHPVSDILKPLSTESTFKFNNEINNTADYFLGYELYYKFYEINGDTTPESNSSTIINTDINKLNDKGVFRLYKSDGYLDNPPYKQPLIEVDPEDKGVSFTVDIGPFLYNVIYPDISYLNETYSISRSVEDDSYTLKGFIPEDFSSDDIDLPSVDDFNSQKYFYLSLFVVSFGIDPDTFNYIYSKLTYLGYIVVQIN